MTKIKDYKQQSKIFIVLDKYSIDLQGVAKLCHQQKYLLL